MGAYAPSVDQEPLAVGRPKKAPTTQIRLTEDVVDLAWKVAPYQGYRSAGDFLSDLLRPLLQKMEADQRGQSLPKRKPRE